jgi:hypothetical protein
LTIHFRVTRILCAVPKLAAADTLGLMNALPVDLTTDEWIFFAILVVIIFGVGGVPRLAERLFGDRSNDAS